MLTTVLESRVLTEPLGRPQQWLSKKDLKCFIPGHGLFREEPNDPTVYNQKYFSAENIAYKKGGYALIERLVKYEDAIEAIKTLKSPIIDLGCGPGFFVEGLRRRGVTNIAGVDISEEAIKKLSPETARKQLYHSSLTKLPFFDGQFASGFSFHVLEHLTPLEFQMAVGEITRIVEKALYLIIPTWDSLTNRSIFDQIVNDPTHRTIATRKWLMGEFSSRGWRHNDDKAKQLDRLNKGWVFFFER
jgi:SAM-dependent methyltransferase